MFDWEDLRHFSAFVGTGSLSAAARQLGVDHATVARRIAALQAAVFDHVGQTVGRVGRVQRHI
ncbi:MAG: LysR family transcriptional regulator, partial [Microbacterium sp.]|nr:LysR family transcriptional regulator [Microbacterium sp.]